MRDIPQLFNHLTMYISEKAKERQKQLTACKARMRSILSKVPNVSVADYNEARDQVKKEYPMEIIALLDSSGFIHKVISETEKEWLKKRKGGK